MDLQALFEQTTNGMMWEEVVAIVQSMVEDMLEGSANYPPSAFPLSSPLVTVAGQDMASQPQPLKTLSAENGSSVPLGAALSSSEGPLQLVAGPGPNAEQSSLKTHRGPLGPMQAGVTPADSAALSVVPIDDYEQTANEKETEELLATFRLLVEDVFEDALDDLPPASSASSHPDPVARQGVDTEPQPETPRAPPCSSQLPLQLVATYGLNGGQSASNANPRPFNIMQSGPTAPDSAVPSVESTTMSEQTAFEAELKEMMASLPSLTDDILWYSPPSSPLRPPDSTAPSMMLIAVPEHDEKEVGVGANPQLWKDISGDTSNYPPPTSPPSSAPVCVLGKQNSVLPQPMESQSADCHPQPVALPGVNNGHSTPIMYQGQVTITQSGFTSSGSGAPPVVSIKRKITDQEGGPYIKKPLNAFMIYRKEQRPYVAAELNTSNSGELNKVVGQKWRSLSPKEKAKYHEAAETEKLFHILEHPNWSSQDNYGKKRKRDRRKIRPGVEDGTRAPKKKQRVAPVQTTLMQPFMSQAAMMCGPYPGTPLLPAGGNLQQPFVHGEHYQWYNPTQAQNMDSAVDSLYPYPALSTIDLSALRQT